MARKISNLALQALMKGAKFRQGNTVVDRNDMRLHGNLIAIVENNVLYISNAGWFSNTTKERLNALPGVNINQKRGVWYLNGKEWDGKGEFFGGMFIKIGNFK